MNIEDRGKTENQTAVDVATVLRHHNVRLDRVEYLPIDQLKGYGRKLRKRSDKAQQGLMTSISSFGIVVPILVDADNTIINGEGIVEAARATGYREVPVLRVEHLKPDEIRLLRLALNKLGEQTEWDRIELAAEFAELLAMDINLEYEVTGFTTIDIDNLVHVRVDDEDDPDELPYPVGAEGAEISRLGDRWLLGVHRVVCGSSLDDEVLLGLMAGEQARLVMTDHPFNLRIGGHVSWLGKNVHREFKAASGEMTKPQFSSFLAKSIAAMAARCVNGDLLYMFIDWRHVGEMSTAIETSDLSLVNIAVWIKSAVGMGSFYRSQHELCFIAKKGKAPHKNNVQLGRFGRNRTNCWSYPGMNSFGAGRDDLLAMHPTCKNVAMIADAIRDASDRGEVVLDGFLGSGTTLIAAERTGRRCFGVELDPLYVDTIVRRWEQATGRSAVLDGSGETFDEVAARRALESDRPDEVPRPEIAPPLRRRD